MQARTDINFLGREAVEKARAEGPRANSFRWSWSDPAPTAMWGGELVLRDGAPVGQVMSGAWGEALGAYVGLAYVRHPDGDVVTSAYLREGTYQVNVAGDIRPATVHLRPPYDPARARGSSSRAACTGYQHLRMIGRSGAVDEIGDSP